MHTYVFDAFLHATQQVHSTSSQTSVQAEPISRDTALALCYGKFQASAPKVKQVVSQIEDRVSKCQE